MIKLIILYKKNNMVFGHAVKCCKSYLSTRYPRDRSLILFADCPLSNETIDTILNKEGDCVACICKKENPTDVVELF